MRGFASNPDGFKSRITQIAQLQGRVLSARDRFADSFARSVRESGDNRNIAAIRGESDALAVEMDVFSKMVAMSGTMAASDGKSMIANAQRASAAIKDHAQKISKAAFLELDDRLNSRLTTARYRLGLLTLLGLGTAILGLGFAHRMFRRTLTKLDQVETARGIAQRAHEETEKINSEVASLNRTLASKVKELEAAQNEIVKKGRMEQLGQLTATIAHELRNPLGSVRTSAFLINRKAGGKGLGIDEQISRIEKGVVRCDNIITQLLDFSRTKKISALPTNLDNWLADIVTEEANGFPANVQIDCSLGLEDKLVPFDAARLQRAVINLLSNAVEAMLNKGGPDTESAAGYPHIWISTFKEGDFVAIRVKDNGPGIDAEIISRVREPLFTTKSFGTGLGIPAIEQIAAQHGGRLDIRSRPGEGAEFTIYVPTTQTQPENTDADLYQPKVA